MSRELAVGEGGERLVEVEDDDRADSGRQFEGNAVLLAKKPRRLQRVPEDIGRVGGEGHGHGARAARGRLPPSPCEKLPVPQVHPVEGADGADARLAGVDVLAEDRPGGARAEGGEAPGRAGKGPEALRADELRRDD